MNNIFDENSPYSYQYGGNPDKIPDLTYEELKNFHSKYYHPSNWKFYMYGDLDFTEHLGKDLLLKCLEFVNKNYLHKF